MSKPRKQIHRRPTRRATPRAVAIEWLEDATGRCARVTALGSRCLMVENYTEIIAFSGDCVRLDSGGGALCVYGSGLCLSDIRPGALVIRGEISRLELPCKGGGSAD